MADVISAISGVTNFFQWLYTGIVGAWQSFAIIVWLVIFVAVQIGFIYIYIKIFQLATVIQPKIQLLLYKIDRFFA